MRSRWCRRVPSAGRPGRWSVISTSTPRPETCSNAISPVTWRGSCSVWRGMSRGVHGSVPRHPAPTRLGSPPAGAVTCTRLREETRHRPTRCGARSPGSWRWRRDWSARWSSGARRRQPSVTIARNAFHDFEHALVGYVTCQSVRGELVRLYYAFASQPADNTIQPYLFGGTIKRIDKTDQRVLGRFTKVIVDFGDVTP